MAPAPRFGRTFGTPPPRGRLGRILLLGIVFFLVPPPRDLWALNPGRPLSAYHLRVWTVESGLPQNTINALAQTDDGYLWIGTPAGLVRFDGVRFMTFTGKDTLALKSAQVLALHEAENEVLWIGTDGATADGIARLSHLLRYMIYESQSDRIDLIKEIQHICDLIELEKLRFSPDDDIDIAFRIEGDINRVLIPPMILVPFVENAFKHGICPSQKSFIHIHLKAENRELRFSVDNGIPRGKTSRGVAAGGLGLENVQRRLMLLYPGAHELRTHDLGETFQVDLVLKRI